MKINRFWMMLLFGLHFPFSIDAQLCTGSLGDPVINITFGAGADPGRPLPSATTNYQYVTVIGLVDGQYSIRNNIPDNYYWHTLTSDHTGDPGGYFMLINASFAPGTFYLDTARGLCENTTYELAAWVMNVMKDGGIQPNITFRVEKTDGTLIQSYNTNNIPSSSVPMWNQYGLYFTTTTGVSDVVLRIINNATGGFGNDLALDDITFRPCGPRIPGTINGDAVDRFEYCEGPAHQFNFNTSVPAGFQRPGYQWQRRDSSSAFGGWIDIASATNASYSTNFPAYFAPGTYQFRVGIIDSGRLNAVSCKLYSVFTIKVGKYPVSTYAINDGPKCARQTVFMTAGGGAFYHWWGPNGYTGATSVTPIPNIQLAGAGKYYVSVASVDNCAKLDSTTIMVYPLPTATISMANDTICLGDQLNLIASGGNSREWISANVPNPARSSNIVSPTQSTIYSVAATNAFSCRDTANVSIVVLLLPTADAGADTMILAGGSVQLSATVHNADIIEWQPAMDIDSVHSLTPIVSPLFDREYSLIAASSFGCRTATDKVFVKVIQQLWVPNAFTPNNDRINDTWNIPRLGLLKKYKVTVYNRWGEVVFQVSNKVQGWDGNYKGRPAPTGVYVYYLEAEEPKLFLKGTVNLIR